jgi:hypothetical protein
MTTGLNDMSQQKAAKIAGISWLIVIAAGTFAEFFIRMRLIVPGDAGATANNILASLWLFRTSIASDIIMLVFDVVVALALFVLLKHVHKGLALLAAFFRLVMNAILGINLINLLIAVQFIHGARSLAMFNADQLHALSTVFLNAHGSGYDVSLVFFGIHLFIIGYLVFKSSSMPRILGILIVAASLGYVIDSFANVLVSEETVAITIIANTLIAIAVIAELSLSVWFIVRGSTLADR